MQIEEYLRINQPIIYQTFLNSLNKGSLSHAYLISGNPGTPLLEVATYLAKTILCDSPNPLACSTCLTCLRIDENNYPDFIVIDGEKSTIKKEVVVSIEHRFENKSFEAKGIMVYVLHLIENMTNEAINSILKFLEEPESNIYAFLTTNNENAILPTIISRCQNFKLKPVGRSKVISEAIQDFNIEQNDAEILSYFFNDATLISEFINNKDSESYLCIKNSVEGLLETFLESDPNAIIFYGQTKISPLLESKQDARYFFDILLIFIEDIFSIQNEKEIILKSYDKILKVLAQRLKKVDLMILDILKDKGLISTNVNIPLLIDHFFINIVERNFEHE